MTNLDVYKAVRARILEYGWTKHRTGPLEGPNCLAGHFIVCDPTLASFCEERVRPDQVNLTIKVDDYQDISAKYSSRLMELAEPLNRILEDNGWKPDEIRFMSNILKNSSHAIVKWNDYPRTTKDDVLALLDQVIEQLEESEDLVRELVTT